MVAVPLDVTWKNNKMACFNDPTPRESLWWGGVVGWGGGVADSKNLDQLWELDQW